MRDAFVDQLSALAEKDPNLILITGDLGFGIFDHFVERFPKQFINAGVAEQNMTGLSAGLALAGKTVFTYSIANFSTLRCLEQIRNDVAYHQLNLNIVASGGGFTYGALGMSHHATEDLAIMRALPGITVVAPCSAWEAAEATRVLPKMSGASYLRLEKGGNPSPHFEACSFEIGRAIEVSPGRDITIICIGGILELAIKAAQSLSNNGYSARVLAMHTLKPLDRKAVVDAVNETGKIITVEEHNIVGGLGSAVAEVIAEEGLQVDFVRLGLPDSYCSVVGDQMFLRTHFGLDDQAITNEALALIRRK